MLMMCLHLHCIPLIYGSTSILILCCVTHLGALVCLLLVRCQEDLASQRSSNDERVRGMSQELVARDLKLQTLEDMCERLREDLKKRDTNIEQ